jgi:hypothetical protein
VARCSGVPAYRSGGRGDLRRLGARPRLVCSSVMGCGLIASIVNSAAGVHLGPPRARVQLNCHAAVGVSRSAPRMRRRHYIIAIIAAQRQRTTSDPCTRPVAHVASPLERGEPAPGSRSAAYCSSRRRALPGSWLQHAPAAQPSRPALPPVPRSAGLPCLVLTKRRTAASSPRQTPSNPRLRPAQAAGARRLRQARPPQACRVRSGVPL